MSMFKGSIEWRGKNADHARLVVSCGLNASGKQIKKYRSLGKVSKRDAARALAAFITELSEGRFIDAKNLTFDQYVTQWKEQHTVKLRPKTRQRYYRIIETSLSPAFGHLKMSDIKPLQIQRWLTKLGTPEMRNDGKDIPLSSLTAHHYYSLLRAMLNKAFRWELIASNPTLKIDPPKVEANEARFYTEEDVDLLMDALESASLKHQAMIHLVLATGCRLAEIAGLKWACVDFEKESIEIITTLQTVPGEGVFEAPPKTHNSKRIISIDPDMIDRLQRLKASQAREQQRLGNKWIDSGYVFVNDFGQHLHPTTPSRWWIDFRRRHKLPDLPFHGFRHTSGTLLLKNGVDLATVSRRLGHANLMITGKYMHRTPEADRQAATVLQGIRRSKHVSTEVNPGNDPL